MIGVVEDVEGLKSYAPPPVAACVCTHKENIYSEKTEPERQKCPKRKEEEEGVEGKYPRPSMWGPTGWRRPWGRGRQASVWCVV